MKKLLIAALISAQLAATPAVAASLEARDTVTDRHRSAFAGARLRIPFGGAESGQPRAALALAPMEHGRLADGHLRGRIGEGFELGLSRRNEVRLSLAGATFGERLAAAQDEAAEEGSEEGERPRRRRTPGQHILRGAAVAGIVAAAVVGGLILFIVVSCDDNRCSE